MAEPPLKPILPKPPGYKESNSATIPVQGPPPTANTARRVVLPSSLLNQKKKKKQSKNCCRICCCFVCVLILILIVVVFAGGGFLYLWFDPKLPVFHLQSFRIVQLNATDKSDGSYLDAKTISRMEIKNPNTKILLHYGEITVEVTTGDGTGLGSKTVPGFIQAKESIVSLKVDTGVINQSIDGGSGRRLNAGNRSKEMLVNVAARTKVGLVVGNLKMTPVKIEVVCGGVRLKRLEIGDMPKCLIHLRKWFV